MKNKLLLNYILHNFDDYTGIINDDVINLTVNEFEVMGNIIEVTLSGNVKWSEYDRSYTVRINMLNLIAFVYEFGGK